MEYHVSASWVWYPFLRAKANTLRNGLYWVLIDWVCSQKIWPKCQQVSRTSKAPVAGTTFAHVFSPMTSSLTHLLVKHPQAKPLILNENMSTCTLYNSHKLSLREQSGNTATDEHSGFPGGPWCAYWQSARLSLTETPGIVSLIWGHKLLEQETALSLISSGKEGSPTLFFIRSSYNFFSLWSLIWLTELTENKELPWQVMFPEASREKEDSILDSRKGAAPWLLCVSLQC